MAERMATIEAQMVLLREDLTDKHRQNRTAIHEIRDVLQSLVEKLHLSDIRHARSGGYAAGAGAVIGTLVALAAHFVDKIK